MHIVNKTLLTNLSPEGSHRDEGLPNTLINSMNTKCCEEKQRVVRCRRCGLVQYQSKAARCLRCKLAMPDIGLSGKGASSDRAKFADSMAGRIGCAVRRLRKERRWTQKRLASAMSIDRPHISRLERGIVTPTVPTLERLAAAFGIDISELFLRLPSTPTAHNVRPGITSKAANCPTTQTQNPILE